MLRETINQSRYNAHNGVYLSVIKYPHSRGPSQTLTLYWFAATRHYAIQNRHTNASCRTYCFIKPPMADGTRLSVCRTVRNNKYALRLTKQFSCVWRMISFHRIVYPGYGAGQAKHTYILPTQSVITTAHACTFCESSAKKTLYRYCFGLETW